MCCSLDKYECLRHGGKKKFKKNLHSIQPRAGQLESLTTMTVLFREQYL